jgi:hypothetical protein
MRPDLPMTLARDLVLRSRASVLAPDFASSLIRRGALRGVSSQTGQLLRGLALLRI